MPIVWTRRNDCACIWRRLRLRDRPRSGRSRLSGSCRRRLRRRQAAFGLQLAHGFHQLFYARDGRDAPRPQKRHFDKRPHAEHVPELVLHLRELIGYPEDARRIACFSLLFERLSLVGGDFERVCGLFAERLPHDKISEMNHKFAGETTHILAGGIEIGDSLENRGGISLQNRASQPLELRARH
jgi:hypothetical protein